MSHRIRKRQIFALLDERLGASATKRLRAHLSICAECSQYLHGVEKLKEVAENAWRPVEPDWPKLDARMEQAIAALAIKPRPVTAQWIPIALTLAATAAIALAIFVSGKERAASPLYATLAKAAFEDEPVPRPQALPVPSRSVEEPLLKAVVLSSLSPEQAPFAGEELKEGIVLETPKPGGMQVDFGHQALAEMSEETSLEIVALKEEEPTIALERGRVLVSAIETGVIRGRGIVVLAGGASFEVITGSAEFYFDGETPLINVSQDGLITARRGLYETELTGGHWGAIRSLGIEGDLEWMEIEDTDFSPVEVKNQQWVGVESARPNEDAHNDGVLKRFAEETLARATPQIRACYEKALKRDPNLTLSVKVRIRVGQRGEVSWIHARGLENSPMLYTCVEDVLRSTRFLAPKNGPVELVLPLRLYPKF